MAGRGKKVRDALEALRQYHAAQAPQRGMFSTLDELMQDAPFETAPVDQWRSYLQPGRMLKRDVMQFPLKGEELQYSELNTVMDAIAKGGYRRLSGKTLGDLTDEDMLDPLGTIDPSRVSKEDLLELVRRHRQPFALTVGDDTLVSPDWTDTRGGPRSEAAARARMAQLYDPEQPKGMRRFEVTDTSFGPGDDLAFGSRLSHESPNSTYQESMTRMPGYSESGHFSRDTISHSRTTSHETPGGRVRLIEEIQSDPHEKAADRRSVDWLSLLTPEENNRRVQLYNLIQEGEGPYRNTSSPERRAVEAEYDALRDAAKRRAPRRGYNTPQMLTEFDLLHERRNPDSPLTSRGAALMSNDDNQPMTHWGLEDEERYQQLRTEIKSGIQDAPFKGPAEYGRLEMRKQLLNAVNSGEDWLALTRGSDQAARYGMDNNLPPMGDVPTGNPGKAAGMSYVYDQVYRGELEKLARQYGSEVVDITVPLKTTGDARPRVMRDSTLETADELEEFMNGGMLSGDMDELFGDTSYIDSVFYQIKDLAEETNIPKVELDRINANLRKVLDDVGVKFDDQGHAIGTTETFPNGTTVNRPMVTGARDVNQNDRDAWQSQMRWVANHVRGWMNGPGRARVTQEVKTFPAMRITDEVRRRVRDVGVPLWSLGAGAVGLEALREEAGEEPSTPQTFAKGGTVKRVLREVFDAEKGAGAVPNNQDVGYRGFETEMPIWKYLYLAKHLPEPRAGSMEYLRKHIESGGTLGQPRFTVRWMPDEERWQVMDHDGRHRAKVLAEIYGDDATIPVHVIPEGEMRARDIRPYMRGAPFLGEQWKDTAERDPMNIRPMLKGFKKGGYASEKQARLMRAVAHGWKPDRIKGPSRAVANEFVDKKDRHRMQRGGMTPERAAMMTHFAPEDTYVPPQPRTTPKMAAKRGPARLMDRFGAGLSEQWMGIDEKGDLQPALYTDWDAPKEEWTWNGEAMQYLPPTKGVRPGIVSDMLSLPALVDDVGEAFTAMGWPIGYDTNLRDIGFVGNAERNMEDISQHVYDKFDLSPPQGLLENAATAAGTMAGQLPIPSSAGKTAVTAPVKSGVRRFLRKAVGAPLEFFSPIVEPSLANYAAGTAFGAGLGTYGGDVFGGIARMFEDDPQAAHAAMRELPTDLKIQVLEYLLANQEDSSTE